MSISFITRLAAYFGIWSFRDIIEIFLMSTILYSVSRWLATHVTQKLVVLMYAYCLLIVGSYLFSLPLVFNFFVAAAPVACILIILMHQDMLQKNFIVPQRIIPARHDQSWIEALIQSCMVSVSQNKDIIILLQKHDDISSYIKIGCTIDTILHKELLLALIQSSAYDLEKFIFLDNNGMLLGINGNFQNLPDKLLVDKSARIDTSLQEQALLLSAKTDALAIKCDHLTSTFTIILRGSITTKVTAHSCSQLINDYVHDISVSKKGIINDGKSSYTQSHEQPRA